MTSERHSALAPFGIKSFRFQWTADLATSWAFEMEALILGWFILVETGSVTLLALYGALQYCGSLISPLFGVAGDRMGHRKVFFMTRLVYVLLAATYCVLAFTHALTPLYALILAGICGLMRTSDMLLRNALIAQTVPAEQLTGALGISRLTYDSAKVAGALSGVGMFAAFGMGWAYAMVLAMYAISWCLTFGIAGQQPHMTGARTEPDSVWVELSESFTYAWANPVILGCIFFAFLVNIFAYPFFLGLLPYVAKNIFELDQAGYGLLSASFSFGGLLGSVILALNRFNLGTARSVIVASAAWFVLIFIYANATSLVWVHLLLIGSGFFQSICLIPVASIMIRETEAKFWGRMMGIRMLAIWGLPAGLLLSGPLINAIGFRATAMLYPAAGIVLTLLMVWHWRDALWAKNANANIHR